MKDFSFKEIQDALHLPADFKFPEWGWRPIDSFCGRVPEYFLAREKLVEILNSFNVGIELVDALLEKLEEVNKNDYWKALAYHLYGFLFLETGCDYITRIQNTIEKWPRLTGLFERDSSLFYAFPYLYRIPSVLNMYRENNLPIDIAIATLRDLFLWMYEYRREYGEWGLMALGWFMFHFNLKLFQLGRLQFEVSHFGYDFHVFENRETGRVVMLAGNGMKFRRDGQFFDTDGLVDSDYYETYYEERGDEYIGYIIDREGFSTGEIARLERESWAKILEKNDDTLGVHIPAGGPSPGHGPMSPERCDESFNLARDFFKRYFKRKRFKAFTCVSWLLDPQFKLYLRETSNIVLFQKRFYLHPVPGADDEQTYERVFSYDRGKWRNAPAVTSLQKIVRQHEKSGGKWRETGGIIPLRLADM